MHFLCKRKKKIQFFHYLRNDFAINVLLFRQIPPENDMTGVIHTHPHNVKIHAPHTNHMFMCEKINLNRFKMFSYMLPKWDFSMGNFILFRFHHRNTVIYVLYDILSGNWINAGFLVRVISRVNFYMRY